MRKKTSKKITPSVFQRKVKRVGGSLSIIIGTYEVKNNNIEEGDTITVEIKDVQKTTSTD